MNVIKFPFQMIQGFKALWVMSGIDTPRQTPAILLLERERHSFL